MLAVAAMYYFGVKWKSMDNLRDEGLSALLIEIESVLDKAEAARSQLENEILPSRQTGGLELPQEALGAYLESATTRLAVALDIAELRGSQTQLAERWKEFSKAQFGVADTHFHHEVDWLECPALSYLQNLVAGIRVARGKDTDLSERYELNKLELLLEKVPHMLLAEKVTPQSEKEVRDVAHKYLELYFTHYTTDVQIQGPVRPFKPDSGVINLKAAIEFKFATTREEIHREIGQLFEDTSGYANSLDWRRFYFVLYQTQALISKDRLKAELEKASRKNWTPVLVSGDGARKKRSMADRATEAES
jgi:hypothetical protein